MMREYAQATWIMIAILNIWLLGTIETMFYYLVANIMLYVYMTFRDDEGNATNHNHNYTPKRRRGILWNIQSYINKVLRPNKPIHVATKSNRTRWKRRKRIAPTNRFNRMTTMLLSLAATMNDGYDLNKTVNVTRFDTDSFPIGIDNRCSGCISPVAEDFEGPLRECNRSIKGFRGTTTSNVMMGTLVWRWLDDEGKKFKFTIPNSYYVPEADGRLLSPQHFAKAMKDAKGTGETTLRDTITLFWSNRKYKLTVPISKHDNVGTFYSAPGYSRYDAYCNQAKITDDEVPTDLYCQPAMVSDDEGGDDESSAKEERSMDASTVEGIKQVPEEFIITSTKSKDQAPTVVADEEDIQPTNKVAELLKHHQAFGHVSFEKLRIMAKKGIIPRNLADCPNPTCSSCQYAKATKKPWRGKPRKRSGNTKLVTKPGQCVSVDQMVSPTPGLIAQMIGFLTKKRYSYATVYVDQYSKLGYVHLQKTSSVEETLEGKKAFEAYCKEQSIQVQAYHADNGIFKAKGWVQDCQVKGQALTFAGVNAHHQNGLAERRIRSLQELTRSMLIHATKRWPKVVNAALWPYALRMANDVYNNTPNLQDDKKRSPMNVFSNNEEVRINPKHYKPFGCPVYVLDNELQKGNIHHKWKQRSRVGVYLGRSPRHGRNVALVLSLETGHVSPQFHVVFDPSFHTVKQESFESWWQQKAGFTLGSNRKRSPITPTVSIRNKRARVTTTTNSNVPNEGPEMERQQQLQQPVQPVAPPQQEVMEPVQEQPPPVPAQEVQPEVPQQAQEPIQETVNPDVNPEGVTFTRSGRVSRPAPRLIQGMAAEITAANPEGDDDIPGEIFACQALYPDVDIPDNILAMKASADPDTMYMHQAMKEKDRAEFLKAMWKEWEDQIGNGNFTIIHRSKLPEGATLLPAVWQMKRKRDIRTRKVKKYKARLNIDGSRMQKGKHYDNTYAPVASWNSIRMLLAMVVRHNWHTKQLDYVLAFPQAPVEREIYMKFPAGIELDGYDKNDYCLQLHRNVYGQKQSGKVWNDFLTNVLVNKVGFRQSKVDECVFYKGSVMYVLYTDDSIIAGPDEKELYKVIEEIKRAKLNITIEGDLQDFLGVNIDRRKDGTIKLSQPHLIKQILKDLRLDDDKVKAKNVPAPSSKLLSRHSRSPDFDNSFDYRSVIGKLNYLEKGSRPDIAYITHQCARFAACPKKEHGEAVRWLGKYLKGTKDKGMIITAKPEKGLEVYVDADFAGNWDSKEYLDPDTARSRHGYLIFYEGCPILHKSQLQGEIALSSTESEYNGLSYALRDAIPLMELLKEMKRYGFPVTGSKAKVHCKVFEDNIGALEMAKTHKFRPRTKHLNVKLHHFRSYVDKTKEITIHKIDTKVQPADMMTKPNNYDDLRRHRRFAMGW